MACAATFPEMNVKHALTSADLERGDDHIVQLMQHELLPRVVMALLRGCVFTAMAHGRKAVVERDVAVAAQLSEFRSDAAVRSAGGVRLVAKHFPRLVAECTALLEAVARRQRLDAPFPRLTERMMRALLERCADCVDHFVRRMRPSSAGVVNRRHFDAAMAAALRDPSYLQHLDGYVPDASKAFD